MRLYIRYSLLVGVLCISFKVFPQDCKTLLQDYFSRMADLKKPESSRVYYLNIVLEYTSWERNEGVSSIEAKIFLSSNIYSFDSRMYSIFSDKNDLFYVNKPQLTIYKFNNDANVGLEDEFKKLIYEAQKELLDQGVITICKDSLIFKDKCKVIRIKTSEEFRSKHNLSQVDYLYNIRTKKIISSSVYFTPENRLKTMKILYKDFNTNYKDWSFKKASDIIFDSNKKLRASYSNYSFSDNKQSHE